ncbi:hypothetical protein [Isobaculum melis]|uniref:Uncharacterized protein n=1 Tax=Isobaculum melis TaxID=142588 RepID=A0A1H9U3P7_9LACT|nr:hypothetical protein [Isobaculum melis]SES03703.1 hypothetical protein SAMN04488559_12043 [Isobaculum melis]
MGHTYDFCTTMVNKWCGMIDDAMTSVSKEVSDMDFDNVVQREQMEEYLNEYLVTCRNFQEALRAYYFK